MRERGSTSTQYSEGLQIMMGRKLIQFGSTLFEPHGLLFVLVISVWSLALTGCDQTFQPFRENNQYSFSMYGYLDASADTQWVRITPVRQQLQMSSVMPDVQVILKDLETGVSTRMNDSLFIQANGFNYLNFWTTVDIKPEHTYRVTATDSTGATSRVTVSIPQTFPTPEIQYTGADTCYALFSTKQVNNLADVFTRWHVRINSTGGEEKTYRIPYREEIRESGAFAHMAEINLHSDWEYIHSVFSDVDIYDLNMIIASGGPEWTDDVASLDDIEYALPEGVSNVENGLGYVVGIVSRSIPYEGDCFILTQNRIE